MKTDAHTKNEFLLLYDGQCPICRKEVAWLRWKNKHGRLGLQDINEAGFDPAIYDTTHDALMAEIHGVYPDGRVIKGVEVFVAAYQAVGLGWLMAPMRWPLLNPLFNSLYGLFARHRLQLGRSFTKRSCDQGHCRL